LLFKSRKIIDVRKILIVIIMMSIGGMTFAQDTSEFFSKTDVLYENT